MKVRPSAGGVGNPVTQADVAHRVRRTPRDWAVDTLCFLLGIGFTALVFVDSADRQQSSAIDWSAPSCVGESTHPAPFR